MTSWTSWIGVLVRHTAVTASWLREALAEILTRYDELLARSDKAR